MFSPVHTRSTDKRVSQAETVTAYGLEFMAMEFYLKQQRWANAQCPPLPRGARLGEMPQAEGFGNGLGLRV